MSSSVNPQLAYYLLLFALTVVLRCIRAYRDRPFGSADPEQLRAYRASYLFFGFELVNVSAGVFILLSEHVAAFVGTLIILYVILVVFSFFIEEKNVGIRVRTVGHVMVSCAVVAVTLIAFLEVDGLKGSGPPPAGGGNTALPWRVAMPYVDMSLNRNFGVRNSPVQSVFVADVAGTTRGDAINAAKLRFFSDSGPQPFVAKAEKSPVTMLIMESAIVAEWHGRR